MDLEQLEKDRTIDPNQLDVEAARQADRFFFWAEQYVAAKAKVDRLEFEAKVLKGRLNIQCREDPGAFGLHSAKAATDKAVESAVEGHEDYGAAILLLQRAKSEAMLLEKAVEAMEQRKRMIEVLITLHGQQYFAGPSVPRNLTEAWKEYQEKSSSSVSAEQRTMTRKRVRTE